MKAKLAAGIAVLIFVFSIMAGVNSLFAVEASYGPADRYMTDRLTEKLNEKISLDLRGISVLDVLKYLSSKSSVNIVASQNIEARVTLFLKDVSIANALDIIMLSTGLAFREKDGVIYVMSEEEYSSLYGETYRDQRSIKVLVLKYADAGKVGEIVGGIKSSVGKIIIDKETGTLVLIDTADKIKIMEETALKIDIPTVERVMPTESKVFELNYNKASDIEAKIQSLLTPGVGTVKIDDKTNRLFVSDLDHALKRISKLIKAFDRKTREVFIEAKMIQVRLNNEYQMGIQWELLRGKTQMKQEFPTTLSTQYGRLIFGDLGRQQFEMTVNWLHTFGDTKTIASPQLTVEHSQEASILVGTREAYVTSTVSQASSTTTTSESVTFVDVGVKLKVQPTINEDGFISMKITPEISSVGRTIVTSNSNEIPIVDTTQASTQVLVKDGHTVLIGGLMKNEVVKSVNKYPVLAEIPLFGALFRSTDDNLTKTELVIFLTPHIVGGDEPLPFSPGASGKTFEGPREF